MEFEAKNRVTLKDIVGALERFGKISFSHNIRIVPLEILSMLAHDIDPSFILAEEDTVAESFLEPLKKILPYNRFYLLQFIFAYDKNALDSPGAIDGRFLAKTIYVAQQASEDDYLPIEEGAEFDFKGYISEMQELEKVNFDREFPIEEEV